MKEDVDRWIEKCLTCLRFRKMPQKTESVPVIRTDAECWEEVMVDLEGPNHTADKDGNIYTMTYICCVCYGILTDAAPKASAAETRRMFANCMFRSGSIPTLVLSDRGAEFKNELMKEYEAIIGIGHRFGTAWRPMEQGLVENKHKETQKIYGMLVKDILQCLSLIHI